jgi:pilus assembly protein CpaB
MNNKAFTISLALAGLAVFMIYSFITSKEEELKAKYGTETAVVVAKRNIAELAEIHETMIEIVSKPKRFIEPGKTTSKQEVVGFIASVPINKGEQITLNKIIAPGVKTGLSKQVSPGKRAVAINVTDDNAVNRLIKPGDRIDILATIDPPGGARGSQITKVVFQDVAVLAVGEYVTTTAPRKVEYDDTAGRNVVRNLNIERNFGTITIELEPQAAAQLTLLKDANSKLSMTLRNSDDTERVNVPGVNMLDVLGPDANRIIRAPAAGGAQK